MSIWYNTVIYMDETMIQCSTGQSTEYQLYKMHYTECLWNKVYMLGHSDSAVLSPSFAINWWQNQVTRQPHFHDPTRINITASSGYYTSSPTGSHHNMIKYNEMSANSPTKTTTEFKAEFEPRNKSHKPWLQKLKS